MSKALQDILGWVALTKAVNVIKDGVPNPFPSWLFTVKGEDRIIGGSVKYNRTYGTRKAARMVHGPAPAHRRALQDEDLVETKFIRFAEEMEFDPELLVTLRNYENYDNSDKAKRLVANNLQVLGTLFGNARIVAVATTLARGNIYFDAEGNILPTSSGATFTFSHQISATNNIGSILDNDSNGIFGATGTGGSWAVSSTNIPLQLRRLQEHASMQHGYEPKIALYGKNIPEYMSQNDYVLDYMARNPSRNDSYLKDGGVPDGLFGFNWIPAWKASYTKADGTKVSLWPSDGITFLPDQSDASAYWSMFEGSTEVPTSINIQTDAMAALNSCKTIYGAYGYGIVRLNPVMVSALAGDHFFPAVKLPDTIYIADVVA